MMREPSASEATDIARLGERLERLECQNRRLARQNGRLKQGVLAGAVIIAAVFLMQWEAGREGRAAQGARITERIRARQIEVVDAQGHARILLGVVSDGRPYVRLLDESSLPVGGMAVMSGGEVSLYVCGPDGKQRAGLSAQKDGSSEIALWHPGGGLKDDPPMLGLSVKADGRAFLSLADDRGRMRAGIGVASDGRANMVMLDQNARPIWIAPGGPGRDAR